MPTLAVPQLHALCMMLGRSIRGKVGNPVSSPIIRFIIPNSCPIITHTTTILIIAPDPCSRTTLCNHVSRIMWVPGQSSSILSKFSSYITYSLWWTTERQTDRQTGVERGGLPLEHCMLILSVLSGIGWELIWRAKGYLCFQTGRKGLIRCA